MSKLKSVLLGALITLSALSASQMVEANNLVFPEGERAPKDLQRDKVSKGPEIVEWADIKPGMSVIDILGGGGYYSEILNQAVGSDGKVYLHNNNAYMPYVEKELDARLKNNRLANVIRHDKETDNLAFEPKSADAVFFVLGYHDMYHTTEGWSIDKDDFLSQLHAALKVGGKFLIIDHSAKENTGIRDSQEGHRIAADYVVDEMESKGFKLVKQSDLLANANDKRTVSPFSPEMRRKTDRFILLFEKR